MQKRKFLALSFAMLVAIVVLSAGVGHSIPVGVTCVPDNCFTTTVPGIAYRVSIVPGPGDKFPIIDSVNNTAEFIYEIRQATNVSLGVSYLDIMIDKSVVTGTLTGGKSPNIKTFIYSTAGGSPLPNYTDNYTIYPSPTGDGAFGNGNTLNFVLRWKDIPPTPFRFSVLIKNQSNPIGAIPNLINIKSKSGTAAVEGSILGPVIIPPGSQSGSGSTLSVQDPQDPNGNPVTCSIKVTLNPLDGSIASATLTPENAICCPDYPNCSVSVEQRAICEVNDLANCGISAGGGGPMTFASTNIWMQADTGSPPCVICNYTLGYPVCPTYTKKPPCK